MLADRVLCCVHPLRHWPCAADLKKRFLHRGALRERLLPVISPLQVVAYVLPVYLLLLGGAVCRKLGIVRVEHDDGIMRAVYTVMLPCYILDKVLGAEVLRSGAVVISAFVLGFSLILTGVGLAWLVGKCIGLERGTGIRTFALSAGSQNFGFTAAPIVESLWPVSALAVLFVHNIGVELAMWSVGVMIMSGAGGMNWRKMLNGPVFAVVVGLGLVAAGLDDLVTGGFRKALSMLGVGAFPLGIFVTGCTIMDLIGKERPTRKVVLGSAVVRLILAPALFLSAAKWLPISTELRQVLVVQAAMPAAITPIILARLYGGRPAIAVQIVVFTTILGIVSLPWIITFGCRWLNLIPEVR